MRDAMFTTDESMGERRVAGITAGWQTHDRLSEARHFYNLFSNKNNNIDQ